MYRQMRNVAGVRCSAMNACSLALVSLQHSYVWLVLVLRAHRVSAPAQLINMLGSDGLGYKAKGAVAGLHSTSVPHAGKKLSCDARII